MRVNRVSVAAFVVCGAICGVSGVGCWPAKGPANGTQGVTLNVPVAPTVKAEEKKTYTRAELWALLVGKTKSEVIAAVGKPHETKEREAGNYWMYKQLTVDPVSGKVDYLTWVRFSADDTVRAVDY